MVLSVDYLINDRLEMAFGSVLFLRFIPLHYTDFLLRQAIEFINNLTNEPIGFIDAIKERPEDGHTLLVFPDHFFLGCPGGHVLVGDFAVILGQTLQKFLLSTGNIAVILNDNVAGCGGRLINHFNIVEVYRGSDS